MTTRTIWKFWLPLREEQVIPMPADAVVRHIGVQDSGLHLWVEVDPEQPKIERTFYVVGTGHPLPTPPDDHFLDYLGSVQPGSFVWHVYEPICAMYLSRRGDRLTREEP